MYPRADSLEKQFVREASTDNWSSGSGHIAKIVVIKIERETALWLEVSGRVTAADSGARPDSICRDALGRVDDQRVVHRNGALVRSFVLEEYIGAIEFP